MSDQLTDLLKCWEVNASPNPDFGREVWRRIATQRRTPWWSHLLVGFSHPAGAAAATGLMVITGWLGGAWSQSRADQLAHAEGAQAYIQAVNPLIHATTHRS